VGNIVFLAFKPMNATYKSNMLPFPAVLILEDIGVYIGTSNCSNVLTDVKAPID